MKTLDEKLEHCFPELPPMGRETLRRIAVTLLSMAEQRECPRCGGKGRIPKGGKKLNGRAGR